MFSTLDPRIIVAGIPDGWLDVSFAVTNPRWESNFIWATPCGSQQSAKDAEQEAYRLLQALDSLTQIPVL